mgnify:CR=1 FL=1
MASLEEELRKQSQWKSLGKRQGVKGVELVHAEFSEFNKMEAVHSQKLGALIAFAKAQVPFYKETMERLPAELWLEEEEWLSLPVVGKELLLEREKDLIPRALPKGHRALGYIQSSGTTGRPTKVLHSQRNSLIFSHLKQREYRWYGWNPSSRLAIIRLPSQLPKPKRQPIQIGQTLQGKSWPNVGSLFQTGPFFGFGVTNPIEEQVKWLEAINPDYLLSYAESLEHLSFAMDAPYGGSQLKGLQSISETMTMDMRERVTRNFPVPLNQNYGLNELGLVASRCPEGGRYHVHHEFFHLEIIREDGRLCQPGERGKILVTDLSNLAMPLIRYDTDDLAVATDQECPCGRTLPCFGEVVGRYSRIAHLPPETLTRVGLLREALSHCPENLIRPLRRFQIVQRKEGSFTLKVQGVEKFSQDFNVYLERLWQREAGEAQPLLIEEVDQLEAGPGGKFQDFISEFQPPLEA